MFEQEGAVRITDVEVGLSRSVRPIRYKMGRGASCQKQMEGFKPEYLGKDPLGSSKCRINILWQKMRRSFFDMFVGSISKAT